LAHVGGVLQPTAVAHQFSSDIYNIFRGQNAHVELNAGIPVLSVTAPNPLAKVSKRRWDSYYDRRFSETLRVAVMQSRVSTLSLLVTVLVDFTVDVVHFPASTKLYEVIATPSFMKLSRHQSFQIFPIRSSTSMQPVCSTKCATSQCNCWLGQ
jgi:hypothetical protein